MNETYDAPLRGVRVLDLTDGPITRVGRLLADLGADVVAVDLAGVTGRETEGPVVDGVPLATAIHRRGIPVRTVDAAEWATLVADASILLENTVPGSAAETALDVPGLRRRHPRLVVLSVSDFGRDNPFRSWRGSNPVFHALTSELSRTGQPGTAKPFVPPGQLPYDTASAQAVVMTLAVYLDALRTGEGDRIDFSVLEGAMQALDPAFGMAGSAAMGQSMASLPRGRVDLSHQYPIFPCADGYVRVCVLSVKQWRGMFAWMGGPEHLADPRYENLHTRFASPEVNAAIGAFFADQTRAALEAGGIEHDVPTAAVLSLDEALETDQMAARGYLREVELGPGVTAPVPAGIFEIDGHRATTLDSPADRSEAPRPAGAAILAARPRTAARRPLEGIRIVDFGIIIVGGDTGRMLGDLGADVLKIESSGNMDGARQSLQTHMAPGFASGHRNKRSVGIDLTDPAGYEFARRLVAEADIVFTNWKPGVADKLGITYEKLRDVNPGVVVVDSSAFGPTGPWSRRLGFGPLVRAASGFTLQWAQPGDEPGTLRFNDAVTVYPDHVSSRIGALGALSMLLRRERTGRGGVFSVSQAEVMMSHQAPDTAAEVLLRRGHALTEPVHDAPWDLYPAHGDDDWIAVTVRGDAEWRALADAIDRPDLADDPALATRSGRDAHRDLIDRAVRAFTVRHSAKEGMALLQGAGVPAGWMIRGIEMPEWEFYRARDDFRVERHPWDTRPYTLENVQYHSERTFQPPLVQAPLLGEHTLQVAAEWLGMTEDEVRPLVERGALEAPPLPDPSTVRSSERSLVHGARTT